MCAHMIHSRNRIIEIYIFWNDSEKYKAKENLTNVCLSLPRRFYFFIYCVQLKGLQSFIESLKSIMILRYFVLYTIINDL